MYSYLEHFHEIKNEYKKRWCVVEESDSHMLIKGPEGMPQEEYMLTYLEDATHHLAKLEPTLPRVIITSFGKPNDQNSTSFETEFQLGEFQFCISTTVRLFEKDYPVYSHLHYEEKRPDRLTIEKELALRRVHKHLTKVIENLPTYRLHFVTGNYPFMELNGLEELENE